MEAPNNVISRWQVDTGIDPQKGLMDHERQDEKVGTLSCILSCFADLAFALTLPFSLCCAIKQVEPGEDVIVSRCGRITDVLRKPGPHFVNPYCSTIDRVNMKLCDIEIKHMGANDSHGSPLVVSAQFVYRVRDSISARYTASELSAFLKIQGESALRAICAQYPYDQEDEKKGACLRKHSDEVAQHLKNVLQKMVDPAGVKIESFNLITVGYDPKVEKLLLANQEAKAEVIARQAIADGTTGIIQKLIEGLKGLGIDLSKEGESLLARDLTLILVNRGGHTSLNLVHNAGSAPTPIQMENIRGKEKQELNHLK